MSNLASQQQRVEDLNTRIALIESALHNQELPQTITTATAAIAPGTEQVFLTYAGVTALTLANPVAGLPTVGGAGQDGTTLVITDTTGHAHTLTTGTNGLNGSKHIATFSGTVGASVTLKAFNGSWWLQVGASAAASVALT